MPHLLAAGFNAIDIVMVWGVIAVLLWFLLTALKRGHKTRIIRIRITVEELRQQHDDDEELTRILDEILGHLEQAEGAGPLRGRRPLSAAHGAIAALVARMESGDWEEDEERDEDGDGGPAHRDGDGE